MKKCFIILGIITLLISIYLVAQTAPAASTTASTGSSSSGVSDALSDTGAVQIEDVLIDDFEDVRLPIFRQLDELLFHHILNI